MSDHPFQAGGPLGSGVASYVARAADRQAAGHLRRMEYVTLFEPRQQGKTSLINRLYAQFSPLGYTFAVRDLNAAKASDASEREWFTALGRWLLRFVRFAEKARLPEPPQSSSGWEDFLAQLGELAEEAQQNLVIVLDEIGAMPPDWATDFFSVIRSVYTTRESFPPWSRVTFVIAGAFNPRELINDRNVSNFNVDQRVELADFAPAEIGSLVGLLGWSPEVSAAAAARIAHWTDGQPYLCQWICSQLSDRRPDAPAAVETLVDGAVETFLRGDTHYMRRISDLADDRPLLDYLRQITRTPTRLIAGLNERHFRLAHILGVIKAGEDGLCRVRNRVCERALGELDEGARPDVPPPGPAAAGDRAEHGAQLRELLTAKQRRLHELQVQQSLYGYSADVSLKLEIEDLEKEIAALQRQLAAM